MKSKLSYYYYNMSISILSFLFCSAQHKTEVSLVNVADGWAGNSVNTVVFRKNSLTTFRDTQFIAFYDQQGFVVVGKRKISGDTWQIRKTLLKGNISDAHNAISIMADGKGYLHLAWDHHNNPLHYCKSTRPYALNFNPPEYMTGKNEQRVSYPEFYQLPNGNLLFFYRSGESGEGNMVINQYDLDKQKWIQIQNDLIDGEQQRSAYWQACVDKKGTIHLSWTWRETPDVASNHDICYARSKDGGKTWEKSTGEKYKLPINASNAEYILRIPANSELINQTSMCTDEGAHPYIATYWRDTSNQVPQYHILYNNKGWKVQNLGFRRTSFSLKGEGTKHIPVSRPQIVATQKGKETIIIMVYRDSERGDKASAVFISDLDKREWKIRDLTEQSLGSWEPTYDIELWNQKSILDLFIEKVEQVDAEGKASVLPQPVSVLEWDIKKFIHRNN